MPGNIINSTTEWTIRDSNSFFSNTTWTNDGTQVETVEIPAEETACGKDSDVLISYVLFNWFEAMYACKKLSTAGYDDSDFETLDEYREFYEKLTDYPGSSIHFCKSTALLGDSYIKYSP